MVHGGVNISKKVKRRMKIGYEVFITVLAVVAVTMSFLDLTERIDIADSKNLIILENSILLIFFIDYSVGLYLAQDKKIYIKKHIFSLIAIIPFNSFFRAFRVVRTLRVLMLYEVLQVFKFLRVLAFSRKVKHDINNFLRTSGFIYIILVSIAAIFFSAGAIYYAEPDIKSFDDALWWSVVTATTLGYGDITPQTHLGRIIASLLMFAGITFAGIYTGLITMYFINKKRKLNSLEDGKIDISHLSEKEVSEVKKYIEFIVSKRK